MVLVTGFDSTIIEEVVAEPYLGHVGLVLVGRVDLLNCEELL